MPMISRLLVLLWLTVGTAAHAEIRADFAMDSDPELTPPDPVLFFADNLKPLWLKALARPEADLQRMASQTIADAHAAGMPNLGEAKPALIKIVAAEATHPAARFAAARALIVLDGREAAASLFDASQRHGADLRQLIEPALAKWKFQPIGDMWHKRLAAGDVRHRDLMQAIRGVSDAGDAAAVPALLAIMHDPLRPAAVRMASARSAGQLHDSGLESHAETLTKLASPPILHRLCAAALLDQHRSETAQQMLLRLAQDTEPSVAAAALTTLNTIDHDLVVPLAEQAMQNDDVNVRQQGVDAYVARPTPQRVALVARLLDDPHVGLRGNVREALFKLAQTPNLDDPIRQAATAVLAGESWRGQEQATLLLAALDHEPVATRFVQLLESPRPEVMITAAWGLRKLAVSDTLPAILDKATRQTESRIESRPAPNELDAQVGHLCEALGLMKYAPAEPLLRRYVPKDFAMGELSRGGAIWALGHVHAGTPDEPLAKLMVERLTEPDSVMPPEIARVRLACAISLGRMKAKSQVERMRQYLGPKVGPFVLPMALRWAIQEITGETLPEPEPNRITRSGWFLEPLDDSNKVEAAP